MKVLMIASWYATPEQPLLGSFFREQAEALAGAGAEVAVIYVRVGSAAGTGLKSEIINGVYTINYSRRNLTPGWERGRCLQRTHMLSRAYRKLCGEWGVPDVVNLRSSLHGYEAVKLCKSQGLPLFFMEHSSYVLTEPPESEALVRLKHTMEFAAVNACVSTTLQEVMLPFDPQVRVIHDPVDEERFFPADTAPHDGFLFRAMGQLRPIKDFDTLIRAFAILKSKSDAMIRLEIAGSGVLHEELLALIAQLNISDSCTLVGAIPREEAPNYMNGCDCFVCSSKVETLSCVLTEAGACGKPLISTECGGPSDIVTPDTGILVPVGDPAAMAEAMKRMTENICEYVPERTRSHIIENFGRAHITAQLLQACTDAVNGGVS